MGKKINCLEGIRAIAGLSIFFCHFRGAFLPNFTMAFWDNSPLKILTAGNPVVRILFVLSGFVISYKYFVKEQYEDVTFDIVKRWFRLAPAVFCSVLLAYILMKLNLYFNVEAAALSHSENFLAIFNNFEPDILSCLREGVYACYLKGANAYVGPLWTMTYEYLGSILVLCAIMVFKKTKARYLFYLVQLIVFSGYYNYFVLGMLICDIYTSAKWEQKQSKFNFMYGILFFVSFCCLAMVNINDQNKMSRIMFGFFMVIMFLTLLRWNAGEKCMGNRFMQWLGKLSFAIYLVHWPVIESFSSWLFLRLMEKGVGYRWVVMICFILSLVVIIVMAYLFNKYIEGIGKWAIDYMKRFFVTPKKIVTRCENTDV